MIVKGQTHNVQRVDVGAESKFNIAFSSKAFRVLSDGLYQDKIGSIVREISSNALDAHIAAGKREVPFIVHLPSRIEPYFAVQDFGIGLSHDALMSIFTTYFQSTKDQSNDMIGAFGLGSKTPFAYTDAFTITSIHDGVSRNYSAFINEEDFPMLTLLGEEATDQGNGVTITVPVSNSDDYFAFRGAVQNQLKYFPVKPLVRNCGGFSFPDIDAPVLVRTPEISLLDGKHGANLTAILGPVGYPINIHNLAGKITADNYGFLNTLTEIGAYLHFNIGEIAVVVSREGISYEKLTFAGFDNLLTKARNSLATEFAKRIANISKPWDQAVQLNINKNMVRLAANLGTTVPGATLFNNEYAFKFENLVRETTSNGLQYDAFPVFVASYGLTRRSNTERLNRDRFKGDIVPKGNVVVLVRDTIKRPMVKLRYFMKQQPSGTTAYIIEPTNGEDWTRAKEIEFSTALGGVEIKRFSEMEEPPKEYADRKGYQRPTAYLFDGSKDQSSNETRAWARVYDKLDEIEEGGIYVIVERMQVEYTSTDALVFDLYRNELMDRDIYGIREADLKKIAGNPNWISALDFARRWRQQNQPNRYAGSAIYHSEIASELMRNVHNIDFLMQNYDKLDKANPVAKVLRYKRVMGKWYQRAVLRYSLNTRINRFVNHGGAVKRDDPMYDRYTKLDDEITEKMPLFFGAAYGRRDANYLEHLLGYIKFAGG